MRDCIASYIFKLRFQLIECIYTTISTYKNTTNNTARSESSTHVLPTVSILLNGAIITRYTWFYAQNICSKQIAHETKFFVSQSVHDV